MEYYMRDTDEIIDIAKKLEKKFPGYKEKIFWVIEQEGYKELLRKYFSLNEHFYTIYFCVSPMKYIDVLAFVEYCYPNEFATITDEECWTLAVVAYHLLEKGKESINWTIEKLLNEFYAEPILAGGMITYSGVKELIKLKEENKKQEQKKEHKEEKTEDSEGKQQDEINYNYDLNNNINQLNPYYYLVERQAEVIQFLEKEVTQEEKLDIIENYRNDVKAVEEGCIIIEGNKVEIIYGDPDDIDDIEVYINGIKEDGDYGFDKWEYECHTINEIFILYNEWRCKKDEILLDLITCQMSNALECHYKEMPLVFIERKKVDSQKTLIQKFEQIIECIERYFKVYQESMELFGEDIREQLFPTSEILLTSNKSYQALADYIWSFEYVRDRRIKEKDELCEETLKIFKEYEDYFYDSNMARGEAIYAFHNCALFIEYLMIIRNISKVNSNESEEWCKLGKRATKIFHELMMILHDDICKLSEYFLKRDDDYIQLLESKANQKNKINLQWTRLLSYIKDILNDDNLTEEELLEFKSTELRNLESLGVDSEYVEQILGDILEKIFLCQKNTDKFVRYREEIKKRLEQYNCQETLITTLATAEKLYDTYVVEGKEMVGFDYSCIAVLYYKALEDAINEYIYIPYRKSFLDKASYEQLSIKNKYFPGKASFYIDPYKKKAMSTCMLASLGHLLVGYEETENLKKFIQTNIKNEKKQEIIEIGHSVIKLAPKRNNSAHGGNIVNCSDAQYAKASIYNDENNFLKMNNVREILMQFLSCLK